MSSFIMIHLTLILGVLLWVCGPSEAFSRPTVVSSSQPSPAAAKTTTLGVSKAAVSLENFLSLDDEDDHDNGDNEEEDGPSPLTSNKKKPSRWDRLNPKVKERIVKAAQERALRNKKKREPIQDKKRRMLMFVKEKQKEKKKASRIRRPLAFDKRTPLLALTPGMEMRGLVISLTKFGAYIDVGSECDGLLHISQFTNDVFIEHPRQMLTPGEEVTVRIRSLNPEQKKLHLTMLSPEVLQAEKDEEEDEADRIPLTDIMVDDELWGELKRVTDFGAYVEVGAAVDGWLHFMDHPSWDHGARPREFMKAGERVRVWVADLDLERQRIKLTANRPPHLPGPRRELGL